DTARSTYRARFVAYTKPLAYKNFEGKVFSDFLDDTTYYVRAAILTKGSDDLIYGNALSFDGQAKAVMTIEDFQPRTGVRGDLVKIYGSRSEERRVGKEGRWRWSTGHGKREWKE